MPHRDNNPRASERQFPAFEAWRRVGGQRPPEGEPLIRLEITKNDIIETRDPLHMAACCETDAREWVTLARYFERRGGTGDDENSATCYRSCDALLARSIDILAAADRAQRADAA